MAGYDWIAAALILIVVSVIAYKILKGLVKLALFALAVISIGVGLCMFLVVADAQDARSYLTEGNNLFLFVEDNAVIAGMETAGDGVLRQLSTQQAEEFGSLLQEENYDAVKEGYERLFIVKSKILRGVNLSGMDAQMAVQLKDSPYAEERAQVFSAVLNEVLQSPWILAAEYKKGNVQAYKETPFFKALEILPGWVTGKLLNYSSAKQRVVSS